MIGIDPAPLFICQFFAMLQYIRRPGVWVLPLGIEDLPEAAGAFDTVFSMGVLYHRKDPREHIERLKSYLRPGGELIIETLIIDDAAGPLLVPEGRYAKMRNVPMIPSLATLEQCVAVLDAALERKWDLRPIERLRAPTPILICTPRRGWRSVDELLHQ